MSDIMQRFMELPSECDGCAGVCADCKEFSVNERQQIKDMRMDELSERGSAETIGNEYAHGGLVGNMYVPKDHQLPSCETAISKVALERLSKLGSLPLKGETIISRAEYERLIQNDKEKVLP